MSLSISPGRVAWACLLAGAIGCTGPSGEPATASASASASARENVMLIDQGIDVSIPDLAGKVVATFTLVCSAAPPAGPADADPPEATGGSADTDAGAPSFEQTKRRLIEVLMTPDDRCRIVEGIGAKADPLAPVRRFRNRWNAMIQRRLPANQVFTFDEYTEIDTALEEEFTSFAYHGTAAASTIGHQNPGVRLVLVERKVGSRETSAQQFECLRQADVDDTVALFRDPEVRDAYARAPLSAADQALEEIATRYNIGLVNESFSKAPRAAIERLQGTRGCAPIELRAYYATLGDLERARRQARAAAGPLRVQSAGNDATQIDSPADDLDCSLADARHLLVGSYDLDQRRSVFSNFGSCVDLYAPGEQVVSSYAGGWLFPARGTSFAAPLAARFASLQAHDPSDPAAARDQLLGSLTADSAIPIRAFPADLFYGTVPASAQGALLGPATSDALPPAGRSVAPPVDLSAVLAPLRQVRQARRGTPP